MLGKKRFAPTGRQQPDDGADLGTSSAAAIINAACSSTNFARSKNTPRTLESNPTQYLSFAVWSVNAWNLPKRYNYTVWKRRLTYMASAQAMGGEVIGGAFENSTKLSIIHSYLQPHKRHNFPAAKTISVGGRTLAYKRVGPP